MPHREYRPPWTYQNPRLPGSLDSGQASLNVDELRPEIMLDCPAEFVSIRTRDLPGFVTKLWEYADMAIPADGVPAEALTAAHAAWEATGGDTFEAQLTAVVAAVIMVTREQIAATIEDTYEIGDLGRDAEHCLDELHEEQQYARRIADLTRDYPGTAS